MMWKALGTDHPIEAHRLDSRTIYVLGRGEDAREGVLSFLEKRAPRFPGRVPSDLPAFVPWWKPRGFAEKP